jgi:Family of unknown function (DUF6065)
MKPLVTFYALTDAAYPPTKADSTLGGCIPLRAAQYCDPILTASGIGWHMKCPIDFGLMFDGREVFTSLDKGSKWFKLENCAIPETRILSPRLLKLRDISPPFLSSLAEPGVVQVWSGFFAKTRKNWAMRIGGIVNKKESTSFDWMDGIVETDWWAGPIFTNLTMCQTNRPIFFNKGHSLFHVFPIYKPSYGAKNNATVKIELVSDDISDSVINDMTFAATRDGTYSKSKGWYAKCARTGRRSSNLASEPE